MFQEKCSSIQKMAYVLIIFNTMHVSFLQTMNFLSFNQQAQIGKIEVSGNSKVHIGGGLGSTTIKGIKATDNSRVTIGGSWLPSIQVGNVFINFRSTCGSVEASGGSTINCGGWPLEWIVDDCIDYARSCPFPLANKVWLKTIAKNISNITWQYWIATVFLLYYISPDKRYVTCAGSFLLTLYLAWPSRSN